MWSSFVVVTEALKKIGCMALPIGGHIKKDALLEYLLQFKPNVVIGLPSLIVSLGHWIEERELSLSIEKVFYAGERLSEQAWEFLRRVLGTKEIHSAGYATVDTGLIGYQCKYCTGTVHHLWKDYQHLEIIDECTGKPAAIGEPGEIVVTNLRRRLMPVIRYRTGDRGRYLGERCRCGSLDPLFSLEGRCDENILIGGTRIAYDEIISFIKGEPSCLPLAQVILESVEGKESFTILTEHRNEEVKESEIAELEKRLREGFIRSNLQLQQALEQQILASVSFKVYPKGKIPRIPKTGKFPRIIDRR